MTDKGRIKLREITEQVSDFIWMLLEVSGDLKDIEDNNEDTEEIKCELDNADEYLHMAVRHLSTFCEYIDKAYNNDKENQTKIAEYGSAITYSTVVDEPMVVEVNTPDEFIIYNEENENDK